LHRGELVALAEERLDGGGREVAVTRADVDHEWVGRLHGERRGPAETLVEGAANLMFDLGAMECGGGKHGARRRGERLGTKWEGAGSARRGSGGGRAIKTGHSLRRFAGTGWALLGRLCALSTKIYHSVTRGVVSGHGWGQPGLQG